MAHSPARLGAACDFVNWHRPGTLFALGLVSIDRYSSLSQTFHSKDLALFKYVMMRMIEELAESSLPCNVFDWDEQSIGLWILPQESGDAAEQMIML